MAESDRPWLHVLVFLPQPIMIIFGAPYAVPMLDTQRASRQDQQALFGKITRRPGIIFSIAIVISFNCKYPAAARLYSLEHRPFQYITGVHCVRTYVGIETIECLNSVSADKRAASGTMSLVLKAYK